MQHKLIVNQQNSHHIIEKTVDLSKMRFSNQQTNHTDTTHFDQQTSATSHTSETSETSATSEISVVNLPKINTITIYGKNSNKTYNIELFKKYQVIMDQYELCDEFHADFDLEVLDICLMIDEFEVDEMLAKIKF